MTFRDKRRCDNSTLDKTLIVTKLKFLQILSLKKIINDELLKKL